MLINEKKYYTPTEISEMYNKNFIDICKELMEKGLSPTEITLKLKLRHPNAVTQALRDDRLNLLSSQEINDEYSGQVKEYIIKNNLHSHRKTFEKVFPIVHQISYKEYLFEIYIRKKYSAEEISLALNISSTAINDHISFYNMTKSRSEARKDAIEKGLIDYTKIQSKSRKTTSKSLSKSNIQDWSRELFKYKLLNLLIEEHFFKTYEVIIGSNEWGILKNSEVDIPIIFINNSNNIIYKFSIEIDHVNWHRDDRHLIKEQKLINNGWIHYMISLPSNINNQQLEEAINQISQDIITKIKASSHS